MTIVLLITFIAVCLSVELFLNYRRKRVIEQNPIVTKSAYKLRRNQVVVPQGIYFGKTHTWAHLLDNGMVRIGLDDFMKHIIGTATRITTTSGKNDVKKNEVLFTLEQDGKKLDIPAPVSGSINRINPDILDHPRKALTESYDNRWIYEMEPANWTEETKTLMLGQKASNWMADEFKRLKEFFAISMHQNNPQLKYATIMQDGGEVAEKVLVYADGEQWKAFQADFLDQPKPE